MVITNIEMTTQYIQDKTSHIHTHTRVKWQTFIKKNNLTKICGINLIRRTQTKTILCKGD